VKDYEPRIALYAGEQGLDAYRRVAERVTEFLKADGALLLEIGHMQGPAVRELLEQTELFHTIQIDKDLSGHDGSCCREGAGMTAGWPSFALLLADLFQLIGSLPTSRRNFVFFPAVL